MISSLTAFLGFAAISTVWQPAPDASASNCRVSRETVRLDDLPEASGAAASRRTPGVFWAHNDSGEPVIFALDLQGAVKGRVRVTGATVDDWEDMAVGPCPQGSCVYIADIGDNNGSRKRITLYRVAEPAPGDAATAPVEVFHAGYPDGPHDAESVFVTRDADVFVVTKGDPGSVALYRFPPRLASGTTVQLQQVGEPMAGHDVDARDRPTGADASSDGDWIAVRTTHWVAFYRAADLISGRWREAFRMDLSGLREPRGEGIAFAGGEAARARGAGARGIHEIVLVGEAGGVLRGSGTFARLACTLTAR
ncbi:MAG TPA: hypothetical protein VJ813_14965 [Vicinamibacterales bacterium]|nr:hypothetical protein [Vicinamibacterales bacterium]